MGLMEFWQISSLKVGKDRKR